MNDATNSTAIDALTSALRACIAKLGPVDGSSAFVAGCRARGGVDGAKLGAAVVALVAQADGVDKATVSALALAAA